MAKTLGTIKKYMNKVLAACCAVLLTFMTFLVLWQVFTRYVLNSPAAFTEELVKYSLIWTGFIGAAYAFSTREHMALTLVRDKLTGRPHQILVIFIDALILLLAIFVITIGGYKLAVSARAEFSALLEFRERWYIPSHRFPASLSSSHRLLISTKTLPETK